MFTTSFWKTCHLWLSLSSLQSRCHLLPKVGDGKSQSLVEALDIRCYRSAASPNCTSMARGQHCCSADNHWNARWTQGSTMRPHWLRRLWAWTMPRFFLGGPISKVNWQEVCRSKTNMFRWKWKCRLVPLIKCWFTHYQNHKLRWNVAFQPKKTLPNSIN